MDPVMKLSLRGGPVATFRWDSAKEVYIKNFSVREIQPII